MNFMELADRIIKSNPNLSLPNNMSNVDPKIQEGFKAIKNNDASQGEQIARSICERNGVSVEDAISQAKQFFNIR